MLILTAFAFVMTPALVVFSILAIPIMAVVSSRSSLSPEASARSDRRQQCQNQQSLHCVSQSEIGANAQTHVDGEIERRNDHDGGRDFEVGFEEVRAPECGRNPERNAGQNDDVVAEVVGAVS